MPPLLIRQYATSCPPAYLSLPNSSKQACDTLISIINDHHLSQYPPSRAYKYRFFKQLVDELEARADYPIDESIYETFLDALSSGSESCGPSSAPTSSGPGAQANPPSPSYKTHYYPLYDLLSLSDSISSDSHPSPPPWPALREPGKSDRALRWEGDWGRLTVFESTSLVEAGTTGLRTWRAALWMGEWLLNHADVVRGKKVLELGSGTGFLGMLVAQIQQRAGGGDIWMTDSSEAVLQRCANNVHLPCNKLQSHGGIRLLPLDWTAPEVEVQEHILQIQPEVVLACDVVFDASIIPDLVKVIRLTLRTAGECWLAGAVRNEETMGVFIKEAETADLHVKDVEWDFEHQNQRVFLGGNEGGEGIGEVRLMCLTRGAGSR